MNTTKAIAAATTELETNAAHAFLARIAAAPHADGCFSLMCEIRRAPQHYSDELSRDPSAIHHWEMNLLCDAARSRRHDLQLSELYAYSDEVGSW